MILYHIMKMVKRDKHRQETEDIMNKRLFGKMNTILAVFTAFIMLFNTIGAHVYADSDDEDEGVGKGKYVSDLYIAYGKTENDAKKWLVDNGWEPVNGNSDFNAGKASFFDDNIVQDQNVAAVMGIRRTDDDKDAVTDLAVMNMKGGYSIPDYKALIKSKKADITELVNKYIPVIQEYRDNYEGKGSAAGQERAKLVCDILNRFYDGDEQDYQPGDTGEKLGDIFLRKTFQEGNEHGADLEKIVLEASGPAMLTVEVLLALSADPGKESWLIRLEGLSGSDLSGDISRYVHEAEGQDLAPSASKQYIRQRYGDAAKSLAKGWSEVHDELLWLDDYKSEHDLNKKDDETDEEYSERLAKHFEDLIKEDETEGTETRERYEKSSIIYEGLREIKYKGEWGETLLDFFVPEEAESVSGNTDAFLPMAMALSDGQRASLDLISLATLILTGIGSEDGFRKALPDIKEIFKDKLTMSIYTGVNRNAFREGVAITSRALMEQNMGRGEAYDKLWNNTGIAAISSYAAAAVGVLAVIGGAVMKTKGITYLHDIAVSDVIDAKDRMKAAAASLKEYEIFGRDSIHYQSTQENYEIARKQYTYYKSQEVPTKMGIAGRWIMGIGGALIVGAAVVKGVQLYKYYQRDMTPIPNMIVDESDVVKYQTDENGEPVTDGSGSQKKNIDFNTYEYYTAVRCNRQDVGEIGDWQSGVSEYQEEGCGDVADLNADMGKEWLAVYYVKSESKGYPILADSLKLSYGSSEMPKGCTKALHLFEYTNAMDLGDTAYAYSNEKNGVYFFWNEDTSPRGQASAFTRGTLAMAGFIGLAAGIIIAVFILMPKKKKEEFE